LTFGGKGTGQAARDLLCRRTREKAYRAGDPSAVAVGTRSIHAAKRHKPRGLIAFMVLTFALAPLDDLQHPC
jgi:hypothetical protein